MEEIRDKFPDSEEKILKYAVDSLKKEFPSQAYDLVDFLPSDKRLFAKVSVMSSWIRANPHDCIDKIDSSPENERLMREAFGIWGRHDPAAAGAYLEEASEFTSSEAELELKYSVATEMSLFEPDKLLPWLDRLEDSKISDTLFERASYLNNLDSDSKITVASRIKDPESRLKALTRTLKESVKLRDSEKMVRVIEGLSLSSMEEKELKDKVLR